MYIVEVFTGYVLQEVNSVDEGIRVIKSAEKEAEMDGWGKPCLDIVDENGNSIY